MTCIDMLNEEHHTLLRMLHIIKTMGVRTGTEGSIECKEALQILDLLVHFIESRHELKEETALFPRVMERAGPEALENLRARLLDHNRERSLMEGMRESIMTHDCESFEYFATTLAERLAEHIRKEYLLFKELEGLLTARDDGEIVAEFARINADADSKLQNMSAILSVLGSKYAAAA